MPRGRHRHSPPLHRLLPPSAIAGVSLLCALGPWVFTQPMMLRGLAAAAAVTAIVGAVVMRHWDTQAGKQVAELTRARASDEWRYEERVAELETDLDESRELRVKLEQRLRAKRSELAGLRNEHAALLRRYATAETERASALEGRRLLEIETAAPTRELLPAPAASTEAAGAVAAPAEPAADVDGKPEAPAAFSPSASQLYLRAKGALARFGDEGDEGDEGDRTAKAEAEAEAEDAGAEDAASDGAESEVAEARDAEARDAETTDAETTDAETTDAETTDADATDVDPEADAEPLVDADPVTDVEPVTTGEAKSVASKTTASKTTASTTIASKNTPPKSLAKGKAKDIRKVEQKTASDGGSVKAGSAEGAAAGAAGNGKPEAAPEDEAQGKPEAVDGHQRATAATTTARAAQPTQQPSGHFVAPTAVAVVPSAPARRHTVEGGFDFFGTKQGAEPAALEAVQNEDLADVVGQEALALHKAEAEADFKTADEQAPPVSQVIDLTAHDETEQIDLQGLRSAVS
ncbi:hypothetical protein ABZ027_07765 [Streptomyces sp. NPDC006332]|uniref:hypothetical protein n=1 Tax=Streptomyces sp. NPDC006332 TaxID=3155456 RepID=UPI0033AF7F8F